MSYSDCSSNNRLDGVSVPKRMPKGMEIGEGCVSGVEIFGGDSTQENGRVALAAKEKAWAGVTVCGAMDSFKGISGWVLGADLGTRSNW